MGDQEQPKWEGKVTTKVRGATADQVWPLLEDFCAIDRWLPAIGTCYRVEGVYGRPGLIRYCASAASGGDEGAMIKWSKERLTEMDPKGRSLSYEITENNVGFKSYVGTIRVVPMDGGDEEGEEEQQGCVIEWSYAADPNEFWPLDGFVAYLESSLLFMAERMEKALQPSV